MELAFVVKLKDGIDLLLLAEPGLDKGGNVTFDKAGKQATFSLAKFAAEPEREIDLDSTELSDEQRTAYVAYWAQRDLSSGDDSEVKNSWRTRSGIHSGMMRRGEGVAPFRREPMRWGHSRTCSVLGWSAMSPRMLSERLESMVVQCGYVRPFPTRIRESQFHSRSMPIRVPGV
ncbi:hypothetical protein ACN469_03000 [Corallococcus terminator]